MPAVSPTISLLVKGGVAPFTLPSASSQSTRTMPLSGSRARFRRAWVVVPMLPASSSGPSWTRRALLRSNWKEKFCSIHSTSVIRVARCSSASSRWISHSSAAIAAMKRATAA